MKASDLIAKLEAMVAEKGDLEIFVSGGEDGLEKLEHVRTVRARQATGRDYFVDFAVPEDDEKLAGEGISGLGRFTVAGDGEQHELGIYLGK